MSNEEISLISSRAKVVIGVLFGVVMLVLMAAFLLSRSHAGDDVDWSQHFASLEAERTQEWSPEASVTVNQEARWPAYRGQTGDGSADSTDLLDLWPESGPPELYRRPIGGGYAGFVIDRGRAYTIEQRGSKEVVSAYELASGKELWVHAYEALFEERMGGNGPRATPTSDGERLYSLGATGVLSALDLTTGALLWEQSILEARGMKNLTYGMSGAPLRVDDKVIVHTSGLKGPGVVAYNALTGELMWEGASRKQGYASVFEVELLGRPHLVNLAATELVGLDPATGKDLWTFTWDTWNGLSCAQPLKVSDDQLFVSTGYGKGAAMVKLTETAGALRAEAIWSGMAMKNKFNSSVLIDGVVFGLDEGRIAAVDVLTGERRWKGKSYGYGQLILADGVLIILGEVGELAMVKPSKEAFEEISTVQALTGRTWNNPALAGGILLVRNATEMVAYDLRATGK